MKEVTREPITHDIKIYPEFFSAVCNGVKRAELRKNDRDYRVGDTLHLMETPRGSCHRTGEFINVKITHIADVGEWMPGYVLLSVELQEPRKAAMGSAMLQGKVGGTLANEGTIPVMQVKPVADLYGISVPGGRRTTYSTDAAEASDFRAMGWSVQEYVKLERYQSAMLNK